GKPTAKRGGREESRRERRGVRRRGEPLSTEHTEHTEHTETPEPEVHDADLREACERSITTSLFSKKKEVASVLGRGSRITGALRVFRVLRVLRAEASSHFLERQP